jgi:enolase
VQITSLKARQIFDSRAIPTIEVDLVIDHKFKGRGAVPSGVSKGYCEALEKRDGGKDFNGQGVFSVVDIINNEIAHHILNKSFFCSRRVR